MNAKKKRLVPVPVIFGLLLERLVNLLQEPGVKAAGVTLEEAKALLGGEETSQKEHSALEQEFETLHEKRRRARADRFSRYMELVGTLRGQFRHNPVMLKRLEELAVPRKPGASDSNGNAKKDPSSEAPAA